MPFRPANGMWADWGFVRHVCAVATGFSFFYFSVERSVPCFSESLLDGSLAPSRPMLLERRSDQWRVFLYCRKSGVFAVSGIPTCDMPGTPPKRRLKYKMNYKNKYTKNGSSTQRLRHSIRCDLKLSKPIRTRTDKITSCCPQSASSPMAWN